MARFFEFPHRGMSFECTDLQVSHPNSLCIRDAYCSSSVDSPTFMEGRKRSWLGHFGSLHSLSPARLRRVGRSFFLNVWFLSLSTSHHRRHHAEYTACAPRNRRSCDHPRSCTSLRFGEREIKPLTLPGNTKIGILAAAFPPSQARSTAFATFGAGAPIGEPRWVLNQWLDLISWEFRCRIRIDNRCCRRGIDRVSHGRLI